MSRTERRKGQAGEREVAVVYRAAGFDCERTPNSGGLRILGDLYGNAPEHVEVKRQEVLRLPLWVAQAEAECGGRPWVVCYRRSGEPWYAVTTLERHVTLVAGSTFVYGDRRPSNGGGS